MDAREYLIGDEHRPVWLDYPAAYRRLVEQSLVDLRPWHLMTTEEALKKYKGLQDRYPCRQLFPFACRQDSDDVACWEREADEAVKIIHDFASPGWEDSGEYPDYGHGFVTL